MQLGPIALVFAVSAACGGGNNTPDAHVFDAGTPDASAGAPRVISTSPADDDTAMPIIGPISVTFSETMNPATITTNTADGACSGSFQVSSDGFGSCVPMTAQPTTSDNTTFTATPGEELLSATRYEIRITTAATDVAGNPLAIRFETGSGFTVRFYHHVLIDGDIDFSAVTDLFGSSTGDAYIFVTHDDDNLYVGLEHGSITTGGTGNRFLYFLFSTDPSLATGNTLSSDGNAKFGAAGTARMAYHWKERINGGDYSEFRIGTASDWNTDWGATNKSVFKTGGYVEASIALSEFGGSAPNRVLITIYAVDYEAYNGDAGVYATLEGGSNGIALEPRDLYGYIELELPSSLSPNNSANLHTF